MAVEVEDGWPALTVQCPLGWAVLPPGSVTEPLPHERTVVSQLLQAPSGTTGWAWPSAQLASIALSGV